MPPHLAAVGVALPADASKDTVAPTSKAWHAAAIAVAIATTAIAGTERQRAAERMSTICSWSTNAKNERIACMGMSVHSPLAISRGHIYFRLIYFHVKQFQLQVRYRLTDRLTD